MYHVYLCIADHHDLRLVFLAATLCLFSSITAISMIAHTRAATGKMRALWLVAASVVAGFGIWATHFIAMLADQVGMPVAYDLDLTVASVLLAIVLCGLGFWLALSRFGPLIGGAVAGIAIAVMHYVGMAALEISAYPVWDLRYVSASIAIGITFSAAALWASFRQQWHMRIASCLLLTIAICGLHFTGMAAVIYHYDPHILIPQGVVDRLAIAIGVASAAAAIVAAGLAGVLVDIRLQTRESQNLRAHIAELEAVKSQLEETSETLRVALGAAASADLAKSRFLATISHELRTPLNAIIGFSDLMASEMFGPHSNPKYRDYSKSIHDSGAHLLALINDILDLTRLDLGEEDLEDQDVDLVDVVAETVRMLAGRIETAQLQCQCEVAPAIPHVRADRRRLRQVLINVISNAIKFTPEGGKVIVLARRTSSGVAIDVCDTGIGIAQEDIPRAMEYFGQVDSTLARCYEGTGLGLPLSRQIMELHGGRLVLRSKPGEGTTVTLSLPETRLLDGRKAAA